MANTSDTHALLRFSRNPRGQLCVALPDGTVCEGVVPVRSFPIQAPLEGISLLGTDGKEVLWLEHLDALAAPQRQLLDEEFAARELIPVVEQIVSVDSISVPSCWDVLTDRGRATLVLKAEEDIRRLGPHHLLITSREGVQYRIPDLTQLDRQSLKQLERFL